MQIVLEQGSIDKSLQFILTLVCYNSFFILVCSPNTYACKGVFNPNIQPNSAEGLHFSAFHYFCFLVKPKHSEEWAWNDAVKNSVSPQFKPLPNSIFLAKLQNIYYLVVFC